MCTVVLANRGTSRLTVPSPLLPVPCDRYTLYRSATTVYDIHGMTGPRSQPTREAPNRAAYHNRYLKLEAVKA